MNFLLDENFPKAAVSVLREVGHVVFDVRGTTEEGMDDPGLFAKAQLRDNSFIAYPSIG